MKRYTPSIERLRFEWNRKTRFKNIRPKERPVPPNSEQWSPGGYKSLHDLLQAVDEIAKIEAKWQFKSRSS